jgi:hypothetical protein
VPGAWDTVSENLPEAHLFVITRRELLWHLADRGQGSSRPLLMHHGSIAERSEGLNVRGVAQGQVATH